MSSDGHMHRLKLVLSSKISQFDAGLYSFNSVLVSAVTVNHIFGIVLETAETKNKLLAAVS